MSKEKKKAAKRLAYWELRAKEEEDQLKQESLRRHLDRVLQGRRRPSEKFIIERLKRK